jgi:Fe-S cluster biosynthesis and repair protein YggX
VASAADTASRIEQFKKMAEADPGNELGHFSLGRAYLDAGQFEQAVESLRKVVELNPNISKAYQLMADAQLKLGKRDSAVQLLTMGVRIANERGDMMPKNAMIAKLQELGAPVADFGGPKVADQPVGEGQVLCSRCGKVKPRMPSPPFSNDQGKMIHEKVCADCWREWIGMGTKVINEMRLPLSDPQAQKIFDQHMFEFLNLK